MIRERQHKLFCFLPLLVVITAQLFHTSALAATLKPVWKWAQRDMAIHGTAFSDKTNEVVLTLSGNLPPAARAEEVHSEHLLRILQKAEKEPSWEAPKVTIVSLQSNTAQTLGFGWDPICASDGSRIYFCQSKKSISGKKFPEDYFNNNDLACYTRKEQKISVLAAPTGSIGKIVLSPDESRIAYSLSDKVNANYEGPIKIGLYDLQKKQNKIISLRKRSIGALDAVSDIRWMPSNQLLVLDQKYIGRKMYQTNVFNASDSTIILKLKATDEEHTIGDGRNCLLLKDGSVWECIQRNNQDILGQSSQWTHITPSGTKSLPDMHVYIYCELSPDQKMAAWFNRSNDENKIYVKSLVSNELMNWTAPGKVHEIVWAPDSTRLSVISTPHDQKHQPDAISKGAITDNDEIDILSIQL
jgi:hypothetical protein